MSWRGHLSLHYRLEGGRTVALDRHEGPLRVLQRLYPEGDAVCHHVLVHPPGGIVGGDELDIDARLEPGTHALITTPGATRFYRSSGPLATQRARLRLAAGARLEWLPLETIAYSGCVAENQVSLALEPGAEARWRSLADLYPDFFPAAQAGTRVALVLTATMLGMALGGWMSGAIFDLTGGYQWAFVNGIAWNLLNAAIAVFLLKRSGAWPTSGMRLRVAPARAS